MDVKRAINPAEFGKEAANSACVHLGIACVGIELKYCVLFGLGRGLLRCRVSAMIGSRGGYMLVCEEYGEMAVLLLNQVCYP